MSLKYKFLFLNSLDVTQLKRYNKILGIKGYSKLRKKELIVSIKKYFSIKKIQRWFRKCMSINDNCIISISPLKYPCWPIKLEKKWIYYNLPDLVDCLLSSGNFRDPYTQRNLTVNELHSLDNHMKKLNFKRKSLLIAKKNKRYYKKQKENDEHIDTIIEEIKIIVCTMRSRISGDPGYDDSILDFNYYIENVYFPTIKYYFELLKEFSNTRLKETFLLCIHMIENMKKKNYIKKEKIRKKILKWLHKEQKNFCS